MRGVGLLRIAVIAVLAAVAPAVILTHTADLVAAPIVEPPPAEALPVSETPAGAGTKAAHPRPIDHAASIDVAPQTDSFGGWFDERELSLAPPATTNPICSSIPPRAFTPRPTCAASPEAGTIVGFLSPAGMKRKP